MDKDLYYENADEFFKFPETRTYFPLVKNIRSSFYSSIDTDHKNPNVKIVEVQLSMNKLIFDDNFFQMGLTEKTKQFVDTSGIR